MTARYEKERMLAPPEEKKQKAPRKSRRLEPPSALIQLHSLEMMHEYRYTC